MVKIIFECHTQKECKKLKIKDKSRQTLDLYQNLYIKKDLQTNELAQEADTYMKFFLCN